MWCLVYCLAALLVGGGVGFYFGYRKGEGTLAEAKKLLNEAREKVDKYVEKHGNI